MFVKQKYKGQNVFIHALGFAVEACDANAQLLLDYGFGFMVETIKTKKIDNKFTKK
jgi:hypothetical protein